MTLKKGEFLASMNWGLTPSMGTIIDEGQGQKYTKREEIGVTHMLVFDPRGMEGLGGKALLMEGKLSYLFWNR